MFAAHTVNGEEITTWRKYILNINVEISIGKIRGSKNKEQ
jgi:hypothetical protein